ncbi:MAG: serine hydrolase [Acidobacteria bacterium]|nr:serine hydrolase [Acidobacteriota bacterium]
MKKISFLIIAALLAAANAFAQDAGAADVAAKTDEYMNAFVKAKNAGGAVLLARDGKILVSRGYGAADAELNVANQSNTKFRIGSLTKQFTSAAVLLLQERGKIGVRDAVCKYLDNCPEAWREITIHQLLTHTSGIPNVTALPDWKTKKVLSLTPAETVALVRDAPLRFKPGTDFEYSNTNYILLGQLVEKVSGQTYEAFLKENIFGPLKMNDTGYDTWTTLVPNRARGYSRRGAEVVNAAYSDRGIPFAAGGLYSTVEDLYKWQASFDGEQILKKASIEAAFTPDKKNYGYGWGTGVWNGRKLVAHSGGIDGFSSHIFKFTDDRAAVIVLLNTDAVLAQTVALDLAAILFGGKYELPKERKEIALDAKTLDACVGKYEVAPNVVLTIAKEDDHLTLIGPGQTRGAALVPETPTSFFIRAVDAKIDFQKDESGRVTGLVFQQMGRTTKARKIE